jgi:hypothetical protein
MDTVTILRRLWRHRLLVLGAGLLAVGAGIVVSFSFHGPFKLESRKYTVGVASARILVDTPDSQVVDVAPKGSDSTGPRANLIASLMVDGRIKDLIARRAGLRPSQLVGTSEAVAAPAAADTTPTRRSHLLSTRVTTISNGAWLPIIEVETQAPTLAGARRLADAAAGGLRDFLDSKAAADAVPDADRLKVSGLGVAAARAVTRGPRLAYSFIASFLVFLGGCAGILMASSLVKALRTPEAVATPDEPDVLADGIFISHADEEPEAWDLEPGEPSWLDAPGETLLLPPAPMEREEEPAAPIAPTAPPPPQRTAASATWWGGDPI